MRERVREREEGEGAGREREEGEGEREGEGRGGGREHNVQYYTMHFPLYTFTHNIILGTLLPMYILCTLVQSRK